MPITSALSTAADFCAASLPNAAAIACRCWRSQVFIARSSVLAACARRSTRSAKRPMSASSCVATSTVTPTWLKAAKISRIAAAESASRLAVGSSAISTAGRFTTARAIARRCCSPPESWIGLAFSRASRPTFSSAARARRAGFAPAELAEGERQHHVVEDAAVVEQLLVLEHEAQVAPQVGQRGALQRADVLAVDQHRAAARPLDRGNQLEQRRLAGARMPGDERELARLDAEGDALQRLLAAGVALGDGGEANQPAPPRNRSRRRAAGRRCPRRRR